MIKNLSQYVAFDAVARHLSFARAARELGLAPSSVAKSVAKLEEKLNVKLFSRTTRAVHLTYDGQTLHLRCADVLAQVHALDELTDLTSTSVNGVLRISAPVGYGATVVMPVVARLLEQHVELRVDLRLSDERVDLVSEGLDGAIRFGQLADSSLICRELEQQSLLLCATPRYLQRSHSLMTLEDLQQHAVIAFRMPGNGRDRPLEFEVGAERVTVACEPRLQVNQGSALVDALLNHCGIAQLPEFMVKELIAKGELTELLPAVRPPALKVNFLTPGSRALTPRLSAFINALRTQIAG